MAGKNKTKSLIRARKRKIFARRSWTVLKIILVLVLLGAAVWGINYFYNSSYFRIKQITIRGNTHYDEELINGALQDLEGENIFEADKKASEDVLVDSFVWIKDAEFRKIFPDRIDIMILERKPLLIISYRGTHYLMDEEGVILEELGKSIPDRYGHLLEVSGAVDHSPARGDTIAKKNLLSCADIYRGFDDDVKAAIDRAGIMDNIHGDIFFETDEAIRVIFGDSSQVVKKIEVLKLLLKEDLDYTIIDLRSPDNPVVKY